MVYILVTSANCCLKFSYLNLVFVLGHCYKVLEVLCFKNVLFTATYSRLSLDNYKVI